MAKVERLEDQKGFTEDEQRTLSEFSEQRIKELESMTYYIPKLSRFFGRVEIVIRGVS